jgi:DNA-binding XRE family transcriptional regulator
MPVEPRGVDVDGGTQAGGGTHGRRSVDDAMRFLRELRQLRNEAGLELAELAARAHYPHHVIVAAEAGPELPELPVLSAYVRGCGGGLAEWEERWRSVVGSPAASLHLPARPAGSSSLAEAGAQSMYSSPPVDPEDQRRILAAITKAATIPAQPGPCPAPAGSPRGLGAHEHDMPGHPGTAAAVPAPGAEPGPASRADAEPAAAVPAPGPRGARTARRAASFPAGAGIAALVATIMCVVGLVLLLLR